MLLHAWGRAIFAIYPFIEHEQMKYNRRACRGRSDRLSIGMRFTTWQLQNARSIVTDLYSSVIFIRVIRMDIYREFNTLPSARLI